MDTVTCRQSNADTWHLFKVMYWRNYILIIKYQFEYNIQHRQTLKSSVPSNFSLWDLSSQEYLLEIGGLMLFLFLCRVTYMHDNNPISGDCVTDPMKCVKKKQVIHDMYPNYNDPILICNTEFVWTGLQIVDVVIFQLHDNE